MSSIISKVKDAVTHGHHKDDNTTTTSSSTPEGTCGSSGTSDATGTYGTGATGDHGTSGPTGSHETSGTHETGTHDTSSTHSTSDTHPTSGAYGTTDSSGPGPASNTAGPHSSNMANKLDPRVDSDLDGSKTVGGNKTATTDTSNRDAYRDPTDAAQVPPSTLAKHIGEPTMEHDDHSHGRDRRHMSASAQETFKGV